MGIAALNPSYELVQSRVGRLVSAAEVAQAEGRRLISARAPSYKIRRLAAWR